jgi:hypothetical protein
VGSAKNGIGAVGIAYNANVGAVRMLDGDVTDAVEAGSLSLAPQHIDIYTNSWGPNDDGRTIEGPAALAHQALVDGITLGRGGKGSIFVFAAGNGGQDDDCNADGYANAPATVTIGAIDQNERVPWYTESCAAMLAVGCSSGSGSSITTTDILHRYTEKHSGSSAAAPQVGEPSYHPGEEPSYHPTLIKTPTPLPSVNPPTIGEPSYHR